MTIQEKDSPFIRKDAVATLGSDGLIGNSIISLIGGSSQYPQIENDDVLKSGPSGGMEQMIGLLQENGANLSIITQNFAKLSQQMVDGKGTVGSLFMDDAIAQDLKKSVSSFTGCSKVKARECRQMVRLNDPRG